ncbi:MAG: gliding motility-associated peptidyl-prolyl isomerase GldI [Flavobacteriaceae bacterium]|nr:gliding motility-associated peptidyl-prolyl isomerase GldI [Flavobacteriaceae bacterium]
MKVKLFLIAISLCFIGCNGPTARKPISKKTNVFLKESVTLNRYLNSTEALLIRKFIAKDSVHTYKESSLGFWLSIFNTKETGSYPMTDDLVRYTYEVYSLNNDLLYPKDSLHVKTFKVDKEELEIEGIQEGIKLMKEGEQAVFLFPSFKAYGLIGDGKKIGVNEPIKVIVELIKIQK